jgi:HlyD family secretion protein
VAIRVGQLAPPAPEAGLVEEVYFQPGEWVAANQPVVSLLPDRRIKVRFYVPEAEVARYRPGKSVRFSCDGCAGDLSAKISYVSPRPEFTPPIIYSRDSRDRMVFMVEALPGRPAELRPGQPVDVVPLP